MNNPTLVTIDSRVLAGHRIQTSLSENRTRELWTSFRPRVKEIRNRKGSDFFSVQVFNDGTGFSNFTPQTTFEKWAAVEVTDLEELPSGIEGLLLPGGKYAVFIHKGLPKDFHKTTQFIFGEWLPQSGYEPDSRPHFEIMYANYKTDDPAAEEEVWVPLR